MSTPVKNSMVPIAATMPASVTNVCSTRSSRSRVVIPSAATRPRPASPSTVTMLRSAAFSSSPEIQCRFAAA